ncbi:hypothetical protein ACN077_04195 [Clostridium chromiireducens]|uniref:hypothetical protein n=1 Tax=Clostridium chromiireducens TaxID=225345 RepID=UPI003AF6FA59
MAKRKKSEPPKNDFAAEEELDVCGFTSEPVVAGECISSFSFDDDSINEVVPIANKHIVNNIDIISKPINDIDLNVSSEPNESLQANASSDNIEISTNKNTSDNLKNQSNKITTNKSNTLEDNRKTPISSGMAPPINGEFLDVKRTYMLRASTVRKVNELKSIHPELNTYVSTIVDLAIAYYYEHIVDEGGKQ